MYVFIDDHLENYVHWARKKAKQFSNIDNLLSDCKTNNPGKKALICGIALHVVQGWKWLYTMD